MSNGHRVRLVLSVIETDSTFRKELVRGEEMWVGRCIFCQAKLVVPLSGEASHRVTVEHIIPRHHGGTDEAENLALACARCNGEKGRRHDNQDRNDPRRLEVTRALQERRKRRWPSQARPPRWPPVGPEAMAAGGESTLEKPVASVTVRSLHIYPLKSAAGIDVKETTTTDRGFEYDRRFMLVDEGGRFVSQRQLPQMALLETELAQGTLVIRRQGWGALEVPLRPEEGRRVEVEVWGDRCEALEIEGGAWFSKVLGASCRLVYMPEDSRRLVDLDYAAHGEVVSFADGFPYLLISQASLEELSERVGEPMSVRRFRPNLVVEGCAPGEEDQWQRIQVGQVQFAVVKPCSRCEIVTIDPGTGRSGKEPLASLATYRRQGKKVIFGQNLLALRGGGVRVGDPVEVLS
ncbi:MAG: MOSC domain-containing protein [Myxococcales bacterium]|nr:MOSC domain-containing protein [Polyangiaceae bacterium]MDW8249113.1 MOSC domain-containing protein [Myxococcales bacterium]